MGKPGKLVELHLSLKVWEQKPKSQSQKDYRARSSKIFGQENMKIPAHAERERQTVNLYAIAATILVMILLLSFPFYTKLSE